MAGGQKISQSFFLSLRHSLGILFHAQTCIVIDGFELRTIIISLSSPMQCNSLSRSSLVNHASTLLFICTKDSGTTKPVMIQRARLPFLLPCLWLVVTESVTECLLLDVHSMNFVTLSLSLLAVVMLAVYYSFDVLMSIQ
jgi:hypothetical protein